MGQRAITKNSLFYGDNLDIMRQYIADESVDLIYLDPPFNSQRNYNILYKDESGLDSNAPLVAFEDTWHWSRQTSEAEFEELKQQGDKLAELLTALVSVIGRTPLTAYLVMMSSRLVELHRVLKPTGCLYLHCDPTASHYLKIVLDMIFGAGNYQNEIIWKRTNNPKGSQFKDRKYGIYTDTIFFYTKSEMYTFDLDGIRQPLTPKEISKKYPKEDERGNYLEYPILRSASKGERPNLVYEYKGFTPPKWGWVVKKTKLETIDQRGDLGWRANGTPYRKYRPWEDRGVPVGNLWDDILRIQSNSKEGLGYPTQKPLALLERIIQASSNPGDVVLDPFCGCGTAVQAAQKLGRTWLGIDMADFAITLAKNRLYDTFGLEANKDYICITAMVMSSCCSAPPTKAKTSFLR